MTDLETLLREALHAVAGATPEEAPQPLRRPRVTTIAAAAVLLVGTGGVVVVVNRDDAAAPGTVPASEVAAPTAVTDGAAPLLAPPRGVGNLVIVTAGSSPAQQANAQGAMLAPDGTSVGLYLQPNPMTGSSVTDGGQLSDDVRELGSHVVAGGLAEGDELAIESYWMAEQCVGLSLSTSPGVERWASALVVLIGSITVDRGAVTVALPAGWQDLGADTPGHQYDLEFWVEVGGVGHQFMLTQQASTDLGPIMSMTFVGEPRPAEVGGQPAWLMRRDDRDERLSYVAFENGDNAVLLRGTDVTDDELVAVAESLRPQAWAATVAAVAGTTTTMAPPESSPSHVTGSGSVQSTIISGVGSCGPVSLDIISG